MSVSATKTDWRLLLDPGHFLSLGAGTGLAPKAPGTVGTLVGVLLYWPLSYCSLPMYLCVVVVMFIAGIPLCRRTAQAMGTHDHPAIVWDEIVGYLLTMALVIPSSFNLILGFMLFRLFDIVKPWPIGFLDRRVHGGFGIMLDDAIAAVFAGGMLVFINYLSYS